MAEVSSSLRVENTTLRSGKENDSDSGRFDLYVICRDKREMKKMDTQKEDLRKNINQKLEWNGNQENLHVGDVGVGKECFTSVQIKVCCSFYKDEQPDMKFYVTNVLEPAVEDCLNVSTVRLKCLSFYGDPCISFKKHLTELIITVNCERPDSNKDDFMECLDSLSKCLESKKVQDYIAHSSSIMPPCLQPTGRYPMLRVAVDNIEVIEETDKATGTPGEDLNALKTFQVILSKHSSQEDPVNLAFLKKEVREQATRKICEKMKWPSSL